MRREHAMGPVRDGICPVVCKMGPWSVEDLKCGFHVRSSLMMRED